MRADITLESIAPEEYVRAVLPATFELWRNARDFERYVDDFRKTAATTYAKRRPFTVGLREGGTLAASCKNYDRELRWDSASLRATGIGAVFTPPPLRGRGYATAMLGALLDAERASGRDLAFLYSDIHPIFYERLGFIALPSRSISLRASSLDGTAIGAREVAASDWVPMRRCFEALDRRRAWSLRRTPLVWDWMRERWDAPPREATQSVQLVVRRGRNVVAYAIGRRAPAQDIFALDDFAFDGDEGRTLVAPLLRAAAGDLRRVGGWLPPPGARDALARGSVRLRKDSILMIAPLSPLARTWWAENKDATLTGKADATWGADHV